MCILCDSMQEDLIGSKKYENKFYEGNYVFSDQQEFFKDSSRWKFFSE